MIKINESDQSGWKYEVYTDYVTIHTNKSTINRYGFSEQDIIDEYQGQSDTYAQSEGVFDSKEEAIEHAKTFSAVTYERQAYGKGINLECHIVYVEEVEYDEDGEFLNGGDWVYVDCEEVGTEPRVVYKIVTGTGEYGDQVMDANVTEFTEWQIDDNPSEEQIANAFDDWAEELASDIEYDHGNCTVEEKHAGTIDAEYTFRYYDWHIEGGQKVESDREERYWLEPEEI